MATKRWLALCSTLIVLCGLAAYSIKSSQSITKVSQHIDNNNEDRQLTNRLDPKTTVLKQQLKSFAAKNTPSSLADPNAKTSRSVGLVSYRKASQQSYGFFYDVPESHWNQAIEIARHQGGRQNKDQALLRAGAPQFYQENWEPEFSCPFERRIGGMGDGGKWVCDPHRIKQLSSVRKTKDGDDDPCLIYSIGNDGDQGFEHGIMDIIGEETCEIHTFEVRSQAEMHRLDRDQNDEDRRKTNLINMHFSWGLLSSKESPRPGYKTLAETVKELGHEGRTIDIFKIDCEGCEWTTFHDWFENPPTHIQQILVEVHHNPTTSQEFFQTARDNGYVIFHKEPNIQFGGGECVEFTFLKLDIDD